MVLKSKYGGFMFSPEEAKKLKLKSGLLASDLVELGVFSNLSAAYEAMRSGEIEFSKYGKCGRMVSKSQLVKYLDNNFKEVVLELKLTEDNYHYIQRQVELEQQDGYEMTLDATVNTMIDYFKGNNFFISNKRDVA